MINLIPARYAKFITSLVGVFILYIEMYGATWHFVPAMLSVAASLGVMGVPNAAKAVPDIATSVTALRSALTAPIPSGIGGGSGEPGPYPPPGPFTPPSNVRPQPPRPPAA